jgi:hypothetical protein
MPQSHFQGAPSLQFRNVGGKIGERVVVIVVEGKRANEFLIFLEKGRESRAISGQLIGWCP